MFVNCLLFQGDLEGKDVDVTSGTGNETSAAEAIQDKIEHAVIKGAITAIVNVPMLFILGLLFSKSGKSPDKADALLHVEGDAFDALPTNVRDELEQRRAV